MPAPRRRVRARPSGAHLEPEGQGGQPWQNLVTVSITASTPYFPRPEGRRGRAAHRGRSAGQAAHRAQGVSGHLDLVAPGRGGHGDALDLLRTPGLIKVERTSAEQAGAPASPGAGAGCRKRPCGAPPPAHRSGPGLGSYRLQPCGSRPRDHHRPACAARRATTMYRTSLRRHWAQPPTLDHVDCRLRQRYPRCDIEEDE